MKDHFVKRYTCISIFGIFFNRKWIWAIIIGKLREKIDIESMSSDYWGTLKQSQFYQPSGFYYFGICFLNLIW